MTTPTTLLLAVSRHTGVDVADMRGDSRIKSVVAARRMFAYLCRRDTIASYPKIAAALGKRHSAGWRWYRGYVREIEKEREAA